jgi:hypothetical protein
MYKLKQELKELATEIRSLKSQRKSSKNGYVSGLFGKRYDARHKHIAYSMLRGRDYEQIENKCNEAPDMDVVKAIMESYNEALCISNE